MVTPSGLPRRWRQRLSNDGYPLPSGGAPREDSSGRVAAAVEDAFITTVHSAKRQLDTLAAVHGSLLAEISINPDLPLSDPKASQALATYDGTIRSLAGLMEDLLRTSERRTTSTLRNQKSIQQPENKSSPKPPAKLIARRPTERAVSMLAGKDDPDPQPQNAQMESCDTSIIAAVPGACDSTSYSMSDSESDSLSESSFESGSESDSDVDSAYVSTADRLSDGDFYNQLISGYEKEGPTMANRGDSAKKMIRVEEKKWIDLTHEFGLDTSAKNKSGLYVADLDLMLHHHWVLDEEIFAHERLRAQMAPALVLAGATSTRPGALFGSLCYEDVEFHVFPPASGSIRARVGMVVNLTKIKRSAGKSRPKKFGFHEEDTLLHDPILYMMSLAFADKAFANDFDGPEDIYNLVVRPGSDRIILPWKPKWRGRPVFQDIQGRGDDVIINVDKAFAYAKARKYLIRLGRSLGFEKQLEWYDLRRGSGKKLHKALAPEESNDYFKEVDVQEIVFGSEPQRDLIHLMGRLLRDADAPKRLTEQQVTEINNDRKLRKLRQKRDQVLARIRKEGCTLRTAADTEKGRRLLERHGTCHRQADSLRKRLHDQRLSRAIQEFHASIHADEINRQLNGIRPSEYLAPSTVQYRLPERARIAKLFSEVVNVSNRDEVHQLRMSLVRQLALLCKRRESPRRHQAKTDQFQVAGAQVTTISVKAAENPHSARQQQPQAATAPRSDSEESGEEETGVEATVHDQYVSRSLAKELAKDETALQPQASQQFYDQVRGLQTKDLDIMELMRMAGRQAGVKGGYFLDPNGVLHYRDRLVAGRFAKVRKRDIWDIFA
ncbi:hypothetical protein DL770_010392 [Monosporascus sp. CRB-9-2]|nr:hypothetical protein DL770_010392 [Monosporascus sp. CRB-9-2]